jgi:hypothetical protein
MLSLREIARRLGIGLNTVQVWRNNGLLTGRVANDKGEYLYFPPPSDLARPRIGRPPGPRPAPAGTPTESAQGGAV